MSLTNGTQLFLKHELFDNDAIILGNTCRRVSIKNTADARKITLDYPGFKYLGVWHTPETDAPFVCLEPWSALPATEGVTDALEGKEDMYHLAPGKTFRTVWGIEITE